MADLPTQFRSRGLSTSRGSEGTVKSFLFLCRYGINVRHGIQSRHIVGFRFHQQVELNRLPEEPGCVGHDRRNHVYKLREAGDLHPVGTAHQRVQHTPTSSASSRADYIHRAGNRLPGAQFRPAILSHPVVAGRLLLHAIELKTNGCAMITVGRHSVERRRGGALPLKGIPARSPISCESVLPVRNYVVFAKQDIFLPDRLLKTRMESILRTTQPSSALFLPAGLQIL